MARWRKRWRRTRRVATSSSPTATRLAVSATATSDDGARTYDFFCAWALFKNADGKRDSLGAEIKFVCRRDDGEWRSTGFDSVAVDRVTV